MVLYQIHSVSITHHTFSVSCSCLSDVDDGPWLVFGFIVISFFFFKVDFPFNIFTSSRFIVSDKLGVKYIFRAWNMPDQFMSRNLILFYPNSVLFCF